MDYAPKGVKFYYMYKALAHPELDGYVNPFTLKERLMHVKEAQRTLGSKITWLCDGMDNDAKHALGNRPNSEFVIDPDGVIVRARMWSDPNQLRADLEEFVGTVEKPTRVEDLDMKTASPPKVAALGVVPRVSMPGGMRAVKIEPKMGETPFYAKLRAEVTQDVLRSGSGTMYLGFHLDPLYHVHWNNLAEPIRFELKAPEGMTVTPSVGIGPEVDVESDIDPREFLVEMSNASFDVPMELSVYYFACNDEAGWCIPVTQTYAIRLEVDRDGGQARRSGGNGFGRQRGGFNRRGSGFGGGGGFAGRGGFGANQSPEMMVERMLLMGDWDGDDRISRDEAPEQMLRQFERMDANGDGFADKDELMQMTQRQLQRQPQPR
ncbi:MAG: hypothetical protein QGG64_15145 [Candidatus Latescibacteria bacterium]|jgi:uncharacterized membrane protein YgcG|nr:hypothetical protein [Candidatus Latescibacterota bacterium]